MLPNISRKNQLKAIKSGKEERNNGGIKKCARSSGRRPSHAYSPPISLAPLLLFPEIPQAVTNSAGYSDPATQAWSDLVSSCDGFIVLSPQYNRSIPSPLKNAIDHLFHEWKGKPVFLLTYGGHGGDKCAAHLRDVLVGGLEMNLVGEVQIALEREYIRTERRVGDGKADTFLDKYEGEVKDVLKKLVVALE